MPKLVHVYIRSVLVGVALSCCFVAALLVLDVAHLRHLILNSDIGMLAVAMMIVFNTILFAGVQFAIVVMGQAAPTPPSGRGPLIPDNGQAAYATAVVPKGRSR